MICKKLSRHAHSNPAFSTTILTLATWRCHISKTQLLLRPEFWLLCRHQFFVLFSTRETPTCSRDFVLSHSLRLRSFPPAISPLSPPRFISPPQQHRTTLALRYKTTDYHVLLWYLGVTFKWRGTVDYMIPNYFYVRSRYILLPICHEQRMRRVTCLFCSQPPH